MQDWKLNIKITGMLLVVPVSSCIGGRDDAACCTPGLLQHLVLKDKKGERRCITWCKYSSS